MNERTIQELDFITRRRARDRRALRTIENDTWRIEPNTALQVEARLRTGDFPREYSEYRNYRKALKQVRWRQYQDSYNKTHNLPPYDGQKEYSI